MFLQGRMYDIIVIREIQVSTPYDATLHAGGLESGLQSVACCWWKWVLVESAWEQFSIT